MAQIEIYKYKKTVEPEVREHGMFEFFGMNDGPLPKNYVREWSGELPTDNLDTLCGKFFLNPPDDYNGGSFEKGTIAVVDGTAYFLDHDSGYKFVEVDFDTAEIKNAVHVKYGNIDYSAAAQIQRSFAFAFEGLDIPIGYEGEPGHHGSSKGISEFEPSAPNAHARCYLHPQFLNGEAAHEFVFLLHELWNAERGKEIMEYLRENYPVTMNDLETARSKFAPELLYPAVLRPLARHIPTNAEKSELDYLAQKIKNLSAEQRKIFNAVTEAGLQCGSVAEIINLTENLDRFNFHPARDEAAYGEFRLEHDWNGCEAIIERLHESKKPAEQALANHITLLHRAVDANMYGHHAAKDIGGFFTSHGMLTMEGNGELRTIYRGLQDLPAKYADMELSEAITETKPLDKNQFWKLIDTAREKAGCWQDMLEPLVESLSKLNESDIIRFKQINDEYQDLAYKEKLWGAAFVINCGCSDDGFSDFRAWLIAQGKEVYMNALANPDSLADLEAVNDLSVESSNKSTPPNGYFNAACFERFTYSASDAYKNKLGGKANIYDVTDTQLLSEQEKSDIAGEITYAADIDVEWGDIDTPRAQRDANLNSLLPHLVKLFQMFIFYHIRYPSEVNQDAIPSLAVPDKYAEQNQSAANETQNSLVMVKDADLTALLLQIHAVGGDYMESAKRNIRILANSSEDFFVMTDGKNLTITPADTLFRRDLQEYEKWMLAYDSPDVKAFFLSVTKRDSESGRITGDLFQTALGSVQNSLREYGTFFTHFQAEMKNGTPIQISLEEWDLMRADCRR